MNYLAHAFLCGDDAGLLIGNFIADHLGSRYDHLPEPIAKGVSMHRNIDTFTDNHPLFKESKRYFYNGYEKYSGVLVDIYFDHLLAMNYSRYSKKQLADHSKEIYHIYKLNETYIPESAQRFLDYVLANDIYNAYRLEDGIERVLYHLSHRIKHGVRLDGSLEHFRQNKSELENNFSAFFSDAITHFKNQSDGFHSKGTSQLL